MGKAAQMVINVRNPITKLNSCTDLINTKLNFVRSIQIIAKIANMDLIVALHIMKVIL